MPICNKNSITPWQNGKNPQRISTINPFISVKKKYVQSQKTFKTCESNSKPIARNVLFPENG